MPSESQIFAAHAAYQNSLLANFERHLHEIVLHSVTRVTGALHRGLTMTNGVIDQTPGNIKLLRNLNNLLMKEMNAAGYTRLVEAFVGEFPGQFPFLQQVIEGLSAQVETPFPPLKFTVADLGVLDSVALNAASSLQTVMEGVAGAAMQRGMFAVGGLKFGTLVETLSTQLQKGIGQARTIADTSTNVFYRTMADRAYQAIQKDLPDMVLRYRYSGPTDLLERAFCRHLTSGNKNYTREEIDAMDNGQLDNCFLTGGGFNCRHQWDLFTGDLQTAQPA